MLFIHFLWDGSWAASASSTAAGAHVALVYDFLSCWTMYDAMRWKLNFEYLLVYVLLPSLILVTSTSHKNARNTLHVVPSDYIPGFNSSENFNFLVATLFNFLRTAATLQQLTR
eukprot:scaffold13361_cov78-Cyclotella_meneghiniana.AAC.2